MSKKQPSTYKLSAQLGVSRATLHTWKQEGCPVERGPAAISAWAAAHGKPAAPSDPLNDLFATLRRLPKADDLRETAHAALDTIGADAPEHFSLLDETGIAFLFAQSMERLADFATYAAVFGTLWRANLVGDVPPAVRQAAEKMVVEADWQAIASDLRFPLAEKPKKQKRTRTTNPRTR